MSTLYLHVGIPKTATTWLQERVFPALEGITQVSMPRFDGFGLETDRAHDRRLFVCAFGRNPTIWSDAGDELFASMLGPREAWTARSRDALMSEEGIGRAGSRHPLFAAHLAEIRRLAERWGFDRVRAIVALRRQDRWFASHYAQVSDRLPGASQADFEEKVARMVDPLGERHTLGALLDYDRLHRSLADVFGTGNVLVLLQEELTAAPADFRRTLFRFLERPDPGGGEDGDGSANVRSAGADVWRLRPIPRRVGGFRLPRLDRNRDATIALGAEASARMLNAWAESNARLATALGPEGRRALEAHGYITPVSNEMAAAG